MLFWTDTSTVWALRRMLGTLQEERADKWAGADKCRRFHRWQGRRALHTRAAGSAAQPRGFARRQCISSAQGPVATWGPVALRLLWLAMVRRRSVLEAAWSRDVSARISPCGRATTHRGRSVACADYRRCTEYCPGCVRWALGCARRVYQYLLEQSRRGGVQRDPESAPKTLDLSEAPAYDVVVNAARQHSISCAAVEVAFDVAVGQPGEVVKASVRQSAKEPRHSQSDLADWRTGSTKQSASPAKSATPRKRPSRGPCGSDQPPRRPVVDNDGVDAMSECCHGSKMTCVAAGEEPTATAGGWRLPPKGTKGCQAALRPCQKAD